MPTVVVPRRAAIVIGLVGSVCLAACGSDGGWPEARVALVTHGHLVHAAEQAGFHVEEAALTSPTPVRPRLAFRTADFDDPRLASLRERYRLSQRVAAAPDEWTAQRMLRQWVHESIPSGTPPASVDERAASILEGAEKGQQFDCGYFSIVYAESALALGWQARRIAVDRQHGPKGHESTHHGIVEIWSNQFAKWVVIDAQSNLHYEKDGVPLSTWEIRAEWLRDRGAKVDHVVGLPPRALKKNPAIVWWDRPEDETATYFWLYIENDALAGRRSDQVRYIFPQDRHNRDLVWYQNSDAGHGRLHRGYLRGRFLPTWSQDDAYWTVGVMEIRLAGVSGETLSLALDAYLPNRTGFEIALDGAAWKSIGDETSLVWRLKTGVNHLRVRSVGPGGVKGPDAVVILRLARQSG